MKSVFFAVTTSASPVIGDEFAFDAAEGVVGMASVIDWGVGGAQLRVTFAVPFDNDRYVMSVNDNNLGFILPGSNKMVKRAHDIDVWVKESVRAEFVLQG